MQRRLFVTSLVCGAAGSGCSAASFALWGTQRWWWCAAAFVVGMTLVARLLRGGLEGGGLPVGLAASVGALAALGVVVAGRSTLEALAVGSALATLMVFLARGDLERVVRVVTALCVALTIVGAGLEVQRRISAIRAAERLRLEILALPSMVVPPCGAAGSIMSRTREGYEQTVWRLAAEPMTITICSASNSPSVRSSSSSGCWLTSRRCCTLRRKGSFVATSARPKRSA